MTSVAKERLQLVWDKSMIVMKTLFREKIYKKFIIFKKWLKNHQLLI